MSLDTADLWEREQYRLEQRDEDEQRKDAMRRRMLAGERGYDVPPPGQEPLDPWEFRGFALSNSDWSLG